MFCNLPVWAPNVNRLLNHRSERCVTYLITLNWKNVRTECSGDGKKYELENYLRTRKEKKKDSMDGWRESRKEGRKEGK